MNYSSVDDDDDHDDVDVDERDHIDILLYSNVMLASISPSLARDTSGWNSRMSIR